MLDLTAGSSASSANGRHKVRADLPAQTFFNDEMLSHLGIPIEEMRVTFMPLLSVLVILNEMMVGSYRTLDCDDMVGIGGLNCGVVVERVMVLSETGRAISRIANREPMLRLISAERIDHHVRATRSWIDAW